MKQGIGSVPVSGRNRKNAGRVEEDVGRGIASASSALAKVLCGATVYVRGLPAGAGQL